MTGRALVDADIKVVVRRVRIETRRTAPSLVTDIVNSNNNNNIKLGQTLPHLVFNFKLKIDGTVKDFDVNNLKLSGCELKLLGESDFIISCQQGQTPIRRCRNAPVAVRRLELWGVS